MHMHTHFHNKLTKITLFIQISGIKCAKSLDVGANIIRYRVSALGGGGPRSTTAATLLLLLALESARGVDRIGRSAGLCEGGLERIAGLDADVLGAQVVRPSLDIIINAGGALYKDLLDALPSLRTRLKIKQVVPLCEGLSLLGADLPLELEVALVGHQENYHFRVGVVAHVLEPLDQVVEGLPPRYVVAKQRTDAASVVAASDGSE